MRRVALVLLLALALGGCDDEPIQVGRGTGTPAPGAPGTTDPATDPGAEGGADAGTVLTQYRDEDFVEADSNRDPFRNYAASFQVAVDQAGGANTGRPVEMRDTSIEEMRLIGIISGVTDPRAMIVDRDGVGHTVRRGQYIGRSEIVQSGSTDALPVELNWRVDRIRPNEVVLTREDPTAPNRPPLTRVLLLREDEDAASEQLVPR